MVSKKKNFLYNPNKQTYDVYDDDKKKDTIPIKYKTYTDVIRTIKKLEKLYKNKKYPHKRISQVAMIMKVRLGIIKKYRKDRYPKAKDVIKRYKLANKYFNFLKKKLKRKHLLKEKKWFLLYK